MTFLLYLEVPEYVKEWAMHSFPVIDGAIQFDKGSAISGAFKSFLTLRHSNYDAADEAGNLAIRVGRGKDETHREKDYNYISRKNKKKLVAYLKEMMWTEFFFYALPRRRVIMAKKGNNSEQWQNVIIDWFDLKGITFDDTPLTVFLQHFYRERAALARDYGIIIK